MAGNWWITYLIYPEGPARQWLESWPSLYPKERRIVIVQYCESNPTNEPRCYARRTSIVRGCTAVAWQKNHPLMLRLYPSGGATSGGDIKLNDLAWIIRSFLRALLKEIINNSKHYHFSWRKCQGGCTCKRHVCLPNTINVIFPHSGIMQ